MGTNATGRIWEKHFADEKDFPVRDVKRPETQCGGEKKELYFDEIQREYPHGEKKSGRGRKN